MGQKTDRIPAAPVDVAKGSISICLDVLQHAKTEAAREQARNELWVRGWKVALAYARRGFPAPDEDSVRDAAISAFVKFAERAREGEFPALTCRKDFFRLLATIAHRTALKLRRAQGAEKRGGKAKFSASAMLDGVTDPTSDLSLDEDAGQFVVFVDFWEQLGADDDLFKIAELIHTGQVAPKDKERIAELVGVSRATVYRKLNRLRAMWREFEARVASANDELKE